MAISLKDINRPLLVFVVIANTALYFVLLTSAFDFSNFSTLISQFRSYLPASLLAVVVGIFNAQIDEKSKARLVFWRWEHPLPGSYAFTKVAESDPRIDPIALLSFQGSLPSDPVDQNRLWFKWYREFKDDPGIKQVHREYLFTRDWTALIALFAASLCPLAFIQMEPTVASAFVAITLVQYLLVRRAAKNHGERFVASVLAYKSSSEK